MAKKRADEKILRKIYELAKDPSRVKQTQRSYWDMISHGLTRAGLCQAIQDWIDDGKDVFEDVTNVAKSHVGKIHYIMKPVVDNHKLYLKVGIEKDPETGEFMMIISSHT